MFDFDNTGLDSLELGSRRRPVKWAVELSLADCRPQKHKARRRQQAALEAAEKEQKHQQHTVLQQQAQQQRLAAHRKHLEQLASMQQQDPAEVTPAQAKHRKEFRDAHVVCLSTEIEQGNVEYKYRLTGCAHNENRRHQLVTQMKFRLSEGSGECFYYLGVEDDGYPRGLEPQELQDSIAVIHRMAASLQATARLVEYVPGGFGRTAALLHIKANVTEDMRVTDSRIAVAGSMDSGKSTLVAVLTHGADGRPLLDNGRGSARMAVFRHKHEIETGRTSSISQQVLGYDDEGRVLNYVGVSTPTPADITAAATHILNFIDMGGHEKYLKTTLYGMTCLLPDHALLCVEAATGVTRITREHLAVAVALEVPTALVVTKADAVDEVQLQHVLEQLHQLMQPVLQSCRPAAQPCPEQQRRQPPLGAAGSSSGSSSDSEDIGYVGGSDDAGCVSATTSDDVPVVLTEQQAVTLATSLSELHSCTAAPAAPSFQQAVFPVFVTSCVTGAGIPLLHAFLSHLKPLQQHKQSTCSNAVEQAGGALDAASRGWVTGNMCGLTNQQSQAEPQHQQPLVSPGIKPASRDGSSQLWGVASSPPHPHRHQPQAAAPSPAAAAAAHSSAAGAPPAAALQAAEDAERCRPGHFQVVHTYDVEGVGWVVSGIAVTGTIEVGQSLLWGPTPEGGFSPVRVTCIQRSHIPVRQIAPGQTATLALHPTGAGLPHTGSRQALLTAAAVAQAAAAEAAAREAAAAIAAVPEPVAKTRRRSPAALKAAAAAAANTAAAAAAAAAAAQRAAETANGRPWWLLPEASGAADSRDNVAAATAAGVCGLGQHEADRCTSTAATRDPAASCCEPLSDQHSADAAAVCCDSVADLFDDDFAAELAAEDSESGSDADLFGAELDMPPPGRSTAVRPGAAGGASRSQVDVADSNMFDELADALSEMGAQRGHNRDSGSSSSSGSGSGLSGNWSFSSSSSSSSSQQGSSSSGAVKAQPDPAGAVGVVGGPGSAVQPPGELQLLGCSPSRWRNKGGVLLNAGAAPHTYWEFEAQLVLLGGHWPPRGLLSGCWPPGEAPAGGTPAERSSQNDPQDMQQLQRQSRKQRRTTKRYEFAYVIHCNSIRQIASVVCMQELREETAGRECVGEPDMRHNANAEDCTAASKPGSTCAGVGTQAMVQQQQQPLQQHCGLTVSIRAAAAVLQGPAATASDREVSSGCASGDSSGDGSSRRQRRLGSSTSPAEGRGWSSSMKRASDAGSVVAVRFKFTHRPEWMQTGARLIVRDRSDGHVAAAGFVTRLMQPHTQLQQHLQQAGKSRQV